MVYQDAARGDDGVGARNRDGDGFFAGDVNAAFGRELRDGRMEKVRRRDKERA